MATTPSEPVSWSTGVVESVVDATDRALRAATHLTEQHAGMIASLRMVARKIDAWDTIVGWALDDVAGKRGMEGRPLVPEHDNVTIPTYLKYCESLGLTPIAALKLPKPKEQPRGQLVALQSAVPRPAGRASARK